MGRSKVVAVNAVKIIFFIQNVNSMILKGAEHYVPHPLCVTFILCFFLTNNLRRSFQKSDYFNRSGPIIRN